EADVVDLRGGALLRADAPAGRDRDGAAAGGRDLHRILVGGEVSGDHHAVADARGIGERVGRLERGAVGGVDVSARREAYGNGEVGDLVGGAGAEAGDAFHLVLRRDHVERHRERAGLRVDAGVLPDLVGRNVVLLVVGAVRVAVGLPHAGDERLDGVGAAAGVVLLLAPVTIVVVERRGPVPLPLEAHQPGREDVADRRAAGDGAVVRIPVPTVTLGIDGVLLAPFGGADVAEDVFFTRPAIGGVERAADVIKGNVPGRLVFLKAERALRVGDREHVVVTENGGSEQERHLASVVVTTIAVPLRTGASSTVD